MSRESHTFSRGLRLTFVLTSVCLALLVALVTVALWANHAPSASSLASPPASTVLKRGSLAPLHVELSRLGGGPPIALSSIAKGHAVVLNVFASNCEACEREIAAFSTVWHADRSKVQFIGVDTNDPDPDAALRLLRRDGSAYPVGIDSPQLSIATSFGIEDLPATFFIARSGRVESDVLGALTTSQLSSRIRALLPGEN